MKMKKILPHTAESVNRLPSCFGNYSPECARDCPRDVAWECLECSKLEAAREANRLRGRRAGGMTPEKRYLLRLGYPPGVLED